MTEPDRTKRVVVGVDASDHSHAALRWAVAHADDGDTIELVHAWSIPAVAGLEAPYVNPSTFEVGANKLLRETTDTVLTEEERERFDVVLTVVHGHASATLVERSTDADLLVVGRRGLGGFKALLLGSVSSDVVHHATCPVVVTPPLS